MVRKEKRRNTIDRAADENNCRSFLKRLISSQRTSDSPDVVRNMVVTEAMVWDHYWTLRIPIALPEGTTSGVKVEGRTYRFEVARDGWLALVRTA